MDGLGFVPGLIAATPFAAAGLAWGFSDERNRFVALAALLPVPLVLAFQFPGGAAPQWAGRYLLVTRLPARGRGDQPAGPHGSAGRARVSSSASVAVTAFGLLWLVQRSHEIADAADRLQARPEAVLISPNGFVPREFGADLWRQEVAVVGQSGRSAVRGRRRGRVGGPTFALVDLDTSADPPSFPGWSQTGSEIVPFLGGVDFRVTSYERA